jgi:tetratricopeptide (TPR) repeat protein
MQIGAVEQARGRDREAAEWFAAADRQFPGFWLFEAHRAQSRAIGGDLAGGIADLRRIAERSPSAEVMDTLAVLLRAQGQAAESREWAARAKAEWDRRLKLAPEAAYGHALEHELVFGTPERAVELARANLAARPFGESRVLLATALVNVGQDRAALAELARAEDSGWRSAPLYALRARILELAGRTDLAEQARAAAIALNPRIFAPETTLVWLSHG